MEMSSIFINYRREDTQQAVGRLTEELGKHFDSKQIFADITSIVPGADFVEALKQGLDTVAAMLVVIGPRWLTASDRQGRRRLDLPGDWVRQEIAEGLRRSGVRVFPVLVDGAEMPNEEELPEALRALVRRQAFPLTVRHWHNDVVLPRPLHPPSGDLQQPPASRTAACASVTGTMLLAIAARQ
jgi:TIR domain